jgi:hypothetical protein
MPREFTPDLTRLVRKLITEEQVADIRASYPHVESSEDVLQLAFQEMCTIYSELHIGVYTWCEWWPSTLIHAAIADWTSSGKPWLEWMASMTQTLEDYYQI